MSITAAVNTIQMGQFVLVLCCVLYLLWWCVAFHPEKSYQMVWKVILLAATLAAGIAGVYFLFHGMGWLPDMRGILSNVDIVIAGVVVYVVLLFVTKRLGNRPVTTELALILGWTALELCTMNTLFAADVLERLPAVCLELLIIASAVLALVCYQIYYQLEKKKAFYTGMVPLILFGAVMAVEAIVTALCRLR